jgi:hypothetical protein
LKPFGHVSLSLINVATLYSVSSFYKKTFKLTRFDKRAVILPWAFSSLVMNVLDYTQNSLTYFHELIVDPERCLLCSNAKAISLHLVMGSLVPTAFTWIASAGVASMVDAYQFPKPNLLYKIKNWPTFFSKMKVIVKKTNHKIGPLLLKCYSLQLVLSSALFYMQHYQFQKYIKNSQFSKNELYRAINNEKDGSSDLKTRTIYAKIKNKLF